MTDSPHAVCEFPEEPVSVEQSIRRRNFLRGAARRQGTISGIGYDQVTQNYLITTANATSKDGKLYRIAISSDPTGGFL